MDLFLLNKVTTLSISKQLEPLVLYINYKFYMRVKVISPEFLETIFFSAQKKNSHFLNYRPHSPVQIQKLWHSGVTQRLSQKWVEAHSIGIPRVNSKDQNR